MNRLTSSSKHSMRTRIITGAVLCVTLIPCILFGTWAYFVMMLLIAVCATIEMINASNRGDFNPLIYAICFVFVLYLAFSNLLVDSSISNVLIQSNVFAINKVTVSPLMLIIAFILLFLITLKSERFTITDACYLYTFSLYIGLAIMSMMYLRFLPNCSQYYAQEGLTSSLLADYVLLGSLMTDIGAYFVGVLFGKHPMAPRISPHKTWEGLVGGVVFSFLFSFFFAMIVSYAGYPLLPGVLDFNNLNWLPILFISLVMPLASVFGDLLFSAVKRYFGIKDFSNILPGHGGILDRIDSISFTCLIVTIILACIIQGWNFVS